MNGINVVSYMILDAPEKNSIDCDEFTIYFTEGVQGTKTVNWPNSSTVIIFNRHTTESDARIKQT